MERNHAAVGDAIHLRCPESVGRARICPAARRGLAFREVGGLPLRHHDRTRAAPHRLAKSSSCRRRPLVTAPPFPLLVSTGLFRQATAPTHAEGSVTADDLNRLL